MLKNSEKGESSFGFGVHLLCALERELGVEVSLSEPSTLSTPLTSQLEGKRRITYTDYEFDLALRALRGLEQFPLAFSRPGRA